MIHSIIRFSIQHKFIVLLLLVLIVGGGLYSLSTINVDSTPDITNNQVQVITVAENLSTADIEQYVTYPIELAMANLPAWKTSGRCRASACRWSPSSFASAWAPTSPGSWYTRR
jgi:Cu/Ag efflux pump CusA